MPDDDPYHEYLWGEESPRAFARKTRFGNSSKISRVVVVQVGLATDASSAVPR